MASVLVLRSARALAPVPAFHRLFLLRTFPVRDVLRAGLDRNCSAHGTAHCATVWQRTRQSRIRLDFRGPSTRRWNGCLWRRTLADSSCNLFAGFLCRRRPLHRRRFDRTRHLEGGQARYGLMVMFLASPGVRKGSARRANSQSSERVLRGSIISSTQNFSAERNGDRSLLRRSSISFSFAAG